MSTSTACGICAENYTAVTRKCVNCPFCNMSACLPCQKRYVLSTTRDPHCMNPECNVMWSSDFVSETFSPSWVNGVYKAHRQELLFERERARMQETIEELQVVKDAEEFVASHTDNAIRIIKANSKELKVLQQRVNNLEDQNSNLLFKHSRYLSFYERVEQAVYHSLGDLQPLKAIVYGEAPMEHEKEVKTAVERKQFILPCPAEGCVGFLSQRYKCGVCEKQTCSSCREIKEDGENGSQHTCDPNVVATVALIKRDSKPCPSCASLIFRMSGCPQMWCTQCKVAFDWNTGKVDSGPVHNPHYFEYARQAGQEPVAQGRRHCNQDIDYYNLTNNIRSVTGHLTINGRDEIIRLLGNFFQTLRHIQGWEMRSVRDKLNETDDPFKVQRIAYIEKRITKEELQKALVNHERARIKYTGLLQIYTMFTDTGLDIMVNLYNDLFNEQFSVDKKRRIIDKTLLEAKVLSKYVNYQLYRNAKNRQMTSTKFVLKGFTFSSKQLRSIQLKSAMDDLPNDE